MNSFEFNKMAGAVLGTALVVFGLKALAGVIYHAEKPEKPGYLIEVAAAATGTEAGNAEQPAALSLGTLLASADATKGQTMAKACAACHDFTKGGPNKVGPNLWGVVMRNHAAHPDFAYSEDMKSHAAEPWTLEALNTFISAPKKVMPGTKMGFGGLKNDKSRADLLAYLNTLSDKPQPLPAP